MSEIHILNVGKGDCTILKSNKGHVTVFDICGGNLPYEQGRWGLAGMARLAARQNFRMCSQPTNPLRFLRDQMGVNTIFRFILSHPDMDHLDGFNAMMDEFEVLNFWDSGVRKAKPDFKGSPYKEEDWDRYVAVRDGKENATVVTPKFGSRNKYFNQDDEGTGGDYLYVYAPTPDLVLEANQSENNPETVNDASYVIVYRTQGGRVLLPGDAHDKAWNHILTTYLNELWQCEFMLAPHHGRDSSRSWDFLDKICPQFSVLGCAASEHLAYDAWNRRKLFKLTQNQTGNIAIYPREDDLDVYIQNDSFAKAWGLYGSPRDQYGNVFLMKVPKSNFYGSTQKSYQTNLAVLGGLISGYSYP